MGNLIVLLIIIAIIIGIVCYIVVQKKNGAKCIGCSHSKSCSNKCDSDKHK